MTGHALGTGQRVDVLVCGGGLAGTMAAVAGARAGASVLLAERYGFFGGNATAGAVAQFNSWQTASGRPVVAGLAAEVVQRLRNKDAAGAHESFVMSNGHRMDRVEYAPEVLKLVLDEMVSEAGVKPLLHATLMDVQRDDRQITRARFLTKSGAVDVAPHVLIDASGDLDALHRAAVSFLDLGAGEQLQPATMMFRFGPVDFARFHATEREQLAALANEGFAQGALARAALHAAREPYSDDAWFNISRIAVDATDAMALGRAEIEGRRQAWSAAQFLRARVPGCERGRLRAFATQVGVRETRRVRGDHVLTADELLQPAHFPDCVAMGAYPIDIHPAAGAGLVYKTMGEDHAYEIPYRSLVVADLDNALVAGRGISATHDALAAIRVMTISMAVGQGAGTAAALAKSSTVRSVDADALRAQLRTSGAVIA